VTYWKFDQRIIGNPTATDYLLGSTESRHDMGRAACHTQGLPSFGSVVLDLDGDHYFLSSKKRSALRFCAGGVERHRQRFRARTSSRDRCGARGREASEPERVAGKIATSGRTRTTPLRSRDDLQPATLLDGLDVFAAAWTQSSCGLVEKWHGLGKLGNWNESSGKICAWNGVILSANGVDANRNSGLQGPKRLARASGNTFGDVEEFREK
jgi:hypothetical protein